MNEARESVIRVRGLRNVFGKQVVHDGLDLDVYRGEVLGVIGGSGAGKSVLLRSIVGLQEPTDGRVTLFGQDTTRLRPEDRQIIDRRFGLMFQDGALFSSLTVLENVKVPLIENFRLPAGLADEIAMLKIRLAGLPSDAAAKYPAQLSGGMRKRAGLARALALDPEVLFLDEPTSGLDPVGAAAFDALIGTLGDALNLTVFLVTHDLDSLYAICDRVAVISDRRVVVVDRIAVVERHPDPWIRQCFQGPRARSAQSHGSAQGTPA
ncbi:ABC transporter ATP-binding protein [Tahibacter soli]|uniref:ATP-binding cassette domain-containing protein n=1 Tax=Tahibacter soli TaxID=2983605 RepID=A0A9X4BGL2_9GAMM|nr:ATP-binding cassette domain-containing protein [Tahibacter soli]MDC8011681.1 ATP-binding cassette domain-containing protein [Tahibacter soli]